MNLLGLLSILMQLWAVRWDQHPGSVGNSEKGLNTRRHFSTVFIYTGRLVLCPFQLLGPIPTQAHSGVDLRHSINCGAWVSLWMTQLDQHEGFPEWRDRRLSVPGISQISFGEIKQYAVLQQFSESFPDLQCQQNSFRLQGACFIFLENLLSSIT